MSLRSKKAKKEHSNTKMDIKMLSTSQLGNDGRKNQTSQKGKETIWFIDLFC